MRRATLLIWFCSAALLLTGVAYAQGAPSPAPSVPGNTVPAWAFYWVLGLATVAGGGLLTVIKILWDRGSKKSVLSEEERTWLRETHAIRSEVPKVWTDLFDEIDDAIKKGETTLNQLVALCEGDKTDLQQQLKERLEKHDQQQAKMLKLAVRVQRAVEALAGLKAPEVENDLSDTSEEG